MTTKRDLEPSREHNRAPSPGLWPACFVLSIFVLFGGLFWDWRISCIAFVAAVIFGYLWMARVGAREGLTETPAPVVEQAAPAVVAEPAAEPEAGEEPYDDGIASGTLYGRAKFIELSTIGLGAAVGALVTLPALGFTVVPPFIDQGVPDVDVGPLQAFPEGVFVATKFTSNPKEGEVSRRTAFIRNNGLVKGQPDFTIISSRCVHLGCPVQPNGPPLDKPRTYKDVELQSVIPAGFGCPCHGGQYDKEGNRIAGPPVRALDRYAYSIRANHLHVGEPYSVSHVDGSGATAVIHDATYSFPGQPVSGIESWMYPIQPPRP